MSLRHRDELEAANKALATASGKLQAEQSALRRTKSAAEKELADIRRRHVADVAELERDLRAHEARTQQRLTDFAEAVAVAEARIYALEHTCVVVVVVVVVVVIVVLILGGCWACLRCGGLVWRRVLAWVRVGRVRRLPQR